MDRPFSRETRIDEWFKAGGFWDDLDFADVAFMIQREFGIGIADEEWRAFCGLHCTTLKQWEREIGPQFTFGRLIELIEGHLPPILLEPLSVLGRTCASAGAFRAIQKVVDLRWPQAPPFAPSTRITAVLSRHQRVRLWCQLRWITAGVLPPLEWPVWGRLATWMCILGTVISLLFAFAASVADPSFACPMVFSGCLAVMGLVGLIIIAYDIPRNVETFRDLSQRVSKYMGTPGADVGI